MATDRLVVRIPLTGHDPLSWVLLQGSKVSGEVQHGGLSELAMQCYERDVVGLIPGAKVTLTSVAMPTKNRKQMLQALPYALEEDLAQDVELLHFAAGDVLPNGELAVAVVDKAWLNEWKERFDKFNINTSHWFPDLCCLPSQPNQWNLLWDSDSVHLCMGPMQGFSCDPENIVTLVRQVMAEAMQDNANLTLPDEIVCHVPEKSDRAIVQLFKKVVTEMPVKIDTFAGEALHLLVQGAGGSQGINLLQGEMQHRADLAHRLAVWKLPAVAAGGVIVVVLAMQSYGYFNYSSKSEQLQTEVAALFKQAMPNTKRMVNPQVQMQRALDAMAHRASGSGGFLDLLLAGGKALTSQPKIKLEGLSYKNGRLGFDLNATEIRLLEELKQQLAENGAMNAEIQSISSRKGVVRGVLSLSGKGGG